MRSALLLSTVVLLAACGGEDEKAAYVADATTVCQKALSGFEALTVPTTAEGFAPYADRLVGVLESAESDLSALTPPEDDRAALGSKVLHPFAALVDEAKAYAGEVRAAGADQAKLLTLLSQRPTSAIDEEYLRSYGLDTCADAVEKAG